MLTGPLLLSPPTIIFFSHVVKINVHECVFIVRQKTKV